MTVLKQSNPATDTVLLPRGMAIATAKPSVASSPSTPDLEELKVLFKQELAELHEHARAEGFKQGIKDAEKLIAEETATVTAELEKTYEDKHNTLVSNLERSLQAFELSTASLQKAQDLFKQKVESFELDLEANVVELTIGIIAKIIGDRELSHTLIQQTILENIDTEGDKPLGRLLVSANLYQQLLQIDKQKLAQFDVQISDSLHDMQFEVVSGKSIKSVDLLKRYEQCALALIEQFQHRNEAR
ncbi:hypothetical protein [Catenovulum sediminis]|uniref:hypothetical protein n=1 Tax=Catenovulum sediminis TaxID=1740262 RepID=UPI001181143A|nr:hypothetical protein [Catenovulum sediminis]